MIHNIFFLVTKATFFQYNPYQYNRHLDNFHNKHYNFWHELYRTNLQVRPFLRFHHHSFLSNPLNIPSNRDQHDHNGIYNNQPSFVPIKPTYPNHKSPVTSSPIQVLNVQEIQEEDNTENINVRRKDEALGLWTTAKMVTDINFDSSKQIEVEKKESEITNEEILTTTEEAPETKTTVTTISIETETDKVTLEPLFSQNDDDTTTFITEDNSITTETPQPVNSKNSLEEFILNDVWIAFLDFQKFIHSISVPIMLDLKSHFKSLESFIQNLREEQQVTISEAENLNNKVISITTHISLQRLTSSIFLEKTQRLENLVKLLKFTVEAQQK